MKKEAIQFRRSDDWAVRLQDQSVPDSGAGRSLSKPHQRSRVFLEMYFTCQLCSPYWSDLPFLQSEDERQISTWQRVMEGEEESSEEAQVWL